MSEILKVKNLRTWFRTEEGTVKALDGVNFSVKKGEAFGLAGESGCGKSVTARSILRILPDNGNIKTGSIYYNDKNILDMEEKNLWKDLRGEEIAMVFQDPEGALDPIYRVGYQIAEPQIKNKKEKKKNALKKAHDVLKKVRIANPSDTSDSYPFELSGGMNQRALIGMMLANDPSLLIADEPTTALDVTIQAQIIKLLEKLKKEYEMSILLITHNLAVISELCDRVGIMYSGSIVEIASTVEIFKNPLHPYTKGLLKALPSRTKSKKLETIPGDVPELINPPPGCRFHPRCSYSDSLCSEKKPNLIEDGSKHKVACHHYKKINEEGES